jgi:hypothetical protein
MKLAFQLRIESTTKLRKKIAEDLVFSG